jgi:hypothetical protein
MTKNTSLLGIGIFIVVVLATAGLLTATTQNTQKAIATSMNMDDLDIKSMMANMKFKMGMITMPIACITIGDALEGVSGIFKDALANETTVGDNQTNSTQAMLMGMMASGMGNMSNTDLTELNDFIVCCPTDEKMKKSMMK